MVNNSPEDFKCGYVALVGEPNVGKSTLMNTLIGQNVSIITHKPQTTRHKILGILSNINYQVVFIDTPGLLEPKYLLQSFMMESAKSAIDDADIVIFMIDVLDPKVNQDHKRIPAFKVLKNICKPTLLVINKVDAIDKKNALPVIDFYSKMYNFKEIFPISAKEGLGTANLLNSIVEKLPIHPPFYPLDMLSDSNERFFVEEIIREKIFEIFREEIPYSTAVQIVEFREQEGKKDFISAEIIIERQSQKGILIGKNGQALKKIGETARKNIEKFLGREVFLELHVKVREKWRESETWLKRLGYKK